MLPYKKQLLKIVAKNGQHLLQMPNGDFVPGLVFTRVYDGLPTDQAYVIAKILVQIKNTETDENL